MNRSVTLRLALGAALLLGLAGFSTMLAVQQADAGAVGKLTVNSTANTDDGKCTGPPNDQAVGNCTLREAIDDVNDGLADTINFHPAVFSKSTPGIIQIDLAEGELPEIEREVTIDNTGTAVVLDCDAANDGSWDCEEGLAVNPTHNGFDFTLIGAKNFVIREIAGDGIVLEADSSPSFTLGDVEISGVIIDVNNVDSGDQGDAGIDIDDIIGVNNLVITNSEIEAEDSDPFEQAGIRLYTNGQDLVNNNVEITNNRIYGALGVDIQFFGDLYTPDGINGSGHTLNVDIYENEQITGDLGHAVFLGYCNEGGFPEVGNVSGTISNFPFKPDGDTCDARHSTINFEVTENGKISSSDDDNSIGDGVRMEVFATQDDGSCVVPCNDRVTVNMTIEDNAIIDSNDDDGVKIESEICCATSDSTTNVSITGNSDIVGDDQGVEVDVEIHEGPDNTANINVDENGSITGEGNAGVEISADVGSDDAGEIDSDENTVNVSVSRNQDIAGDNDDGVDIDIVNGKESGSGDADRNVTTVAVDDNGDIDGDDDGVEVQARSGTEFGPGDADDNTTTVSVSGNGTIDGADDDGIEIDVISGHIEEDPIANVTGDGNVTEVVIDENGSIKGHSGDGVFVYSRAGGLEPTGEENHTSVEVTGNAEIRGMQGGNGDGVHIESKVCCDPDNENGGQTNFVNISGNGDIIGQDRDGIDIDVLCCSINTVLIQDNTGVIKGNDDNGIEISPCLESGSPDDGESLEVFNFEPDGDMTCLADSITMLMITGNNISDSGHDGILICCGAFQFPLNQAPPAGVAGGALKSVIADNVISHNGEDGIDLDTTIGINIVENEIFQNGTSALDGDNGVEIDWQFAHDIFDDNGLKVPSHFNRISQNSIYDNVGLGINLIGITSLDPINTLPASGTEEPGWPLADGVGCISFPSSPVMSNDCIPYPKILFTGGPTVAKVSGQACANCHVELFIADPTPTDQTGPLGRQFGEGRTYLVTTTADDLGDFSVNLPCGLAGGELTATATDKLKNTSEFASNIPFPGTPACAAATEQPTEPPAATDTPVPPAPTATAAPPTVTAEPAGVCGDVNSDGVTNAVDASLILQMGAGIIADLPKGNAAGDVNADGSTNAVDATLILQQAASMIAGLSC